MTRSAGPLAVLVLLAVVACQPATPGARDVQWHRFPVSLSARVEPAIAVIYSSDNIGPTTTLARLGYPDRDLFRLHLDHPGLKVVLTSCPANRYSGERKLSDASEATATWRSLALDPNFDWVDLGGLGYTHSPPGDTHLDHHEFSVRQSGCNIDHRKLGEPDYCRRQMTLARAAYRTAGIPDERVLVMRFPGTEHSPQALKAAAEAGFIAVLDAGNDANPGSEWWTPLPGGGEILEIRNSNALKLFAIAQELEAGLATGRIAPEAAVDSPEFAAALERGTSYLRTIEATGGLLHLVDEWQETFRRIGQTRPRYLLISALLREVETRYGPRAWYPTSRELVLWLDARRHGRLTRAEAPEGLIVIVEPPDSWALLRLPGLDNASIRVTLPERAAGRIDDVLIKEAEGEWSRLDPARWWKQGREAIVLFPLHGKVLLRIVSRG